MYQITKEFKFSMGHALYHYSGACHNVHGHNYKLHVEVQSEILDDAGFVMDFSDLKDIVNKIIDKYFDHKFLYFSLDERYKLFQQLDGAISLDFEPTAENLIRHIATLIEEKNLISMFGIYVSKLTLWETDTSYTTYCIDNK